ncbi:MAG: beta-lactamase family protein [Armatimonadetes bacterium]|nr:beta-lactamase family protein [Armatimonadota bacterium]
MFIPALLLLSHGTATVQGFDVQRLHLIGTRMREFVDQKQVAGVVTLIQRKGHRVWLDCQGLANVEERRPMEPDTIFQVMSMTKPVTAIAVMLCVERGLLRLDDKVERYLPQFANLKVAQADGTLKPRTKALTVRHLLTHTSGLSSTDPGGLSDDEKIKLTLAQYADHFGSDPLQAQPGERIAYSGPGIAAAGRIVEIVTGQKLEDFMQNEIFGPLGMKDTTFFARESAHPRIASMYVAEKGILSKFQPDPFRKGAKLANPAGGLYSTASDMATLIQCIANHGSLGKFRMLSPRSTEVMTTVQTGDLLSDGSDAQGYGLGFSVIRGAAGTQTLRPIGSFGHTGAFCTEYWADPKSGVVCVFMSQSFSDEVRKTFNAMANAAFVGP